MPLNDVMEAHADKLRAKTGVANKLSIADMTRLLDDLKWGKENLLRGTSDQYRELSGPVFLCASTASSIYTSVANFNEGDWLTYSATVSNSSNRPVKLEVWFFKKENGSAPMGDNDAKPYHASYHSQPVLVGELDKQISLSFQKPKDALSVRTYLIFSPAASNVPETIKVKDERLYAGTEPGVWTPNPADKVGG